MDNSNLTEAKIELQYSEKISRLFIFRFLWMYILMFVLWVWMIWIALISFVHFWYMLILGKRQETLWKKQVRLFRTVMKWNSYIMNLVDKRPKFIED